MGKFVSFGEIMLRLKAPGHERFFQSPQFEATFGGGEANVAVALANYGLQSSFISALPGNAIGDAAIRELRGFGVDTHSIVRSGSRVGIYFLEAGANQRPSNVVYDRAGSSICEAAPGDFDWEKIFADAKWFHITGITPALSQSAADLSMEAITVAGKNGVTVSCDFNFRGKLWKYGKSAPDVMGELVRHVDGDCDIASYSEHHVEIWRDHLNLDFNSIEIDARGFKNFCTGYGVLRSSSAADQHANKNPEYPQICFHIFRT